MSKFPCLVCLILREELFKPGQSGPFQPCSIEQVLQTIQCAREAGSAEEKEAILSGESLRDVDNVFRIVECADPHVAVSFDCLHANQEGMFGDHLFVELKVVINSIGRAAVVKVEQAFSAMPRWQGLYHFDNVFEMKFNDRSKEDDISKILVFASHGVLTEQDNCAGYLLLRCIRAYVMFDLYIALEVQTSNTITSGQEALTSLSVLLNNHTRTHVFDDILAKGATHVYNTKPNKKMHGPLKQSYQQQTNFKNVVEQILHVDHDQLSSQYIRCKIEEHADYVRLTCGDPNDPSNDSDDNDLNVAPPEEDLYIMVGSRQRPKSFEVIEMTHSNNPVFERFRIKINNFLNYTHVGRVLLDQQGVRNIQLNANDQVIEYHYLKVNYESMVDWCEHTDHLCCSPSFHGTPRYDYVIIKTENGHIFGWLLFIFKCLAIKKTALALVHPYDAPNGARSRKDKHLDFF
ncbi:hypothetical protein J3R82DRAFT_2155 [Butyriboletus roseoflavus]|nr:hypothetical protein J3R82DRAFT_2155 [Butyriboletus roseoflavus]